MRGRREEEDRGKKSNLSTFPSHQQGTAIKFIPASRTTVLLYAIKYQVDNGNRKHQTDKTSDTDQTSNLNHINNSNERYSPPAELHQEVSGNTML